MKRFIYSIYDMALSFFVCSSLSCSFVHQTSYTLIVFFCVYVCVYIHIHFSAFIAFVHLNSIYNMNCCPFLTEKETKNIPCWCFFFISSSSSRERGSHVPSIFSHTHKQTQIHVYFVINRSIDSYSVSFFFLLSIIYG